jgi:hypothetical protein
MPRFVGVILMTVIAINLAAWGLYMGLTPRLPSGGVSASAALPIDESKIPANENDTDASYIGATTSVETATTSIQ